MLWNITELLYIFETDAERFFAPFHVNFGQLLALLTAIVAGSSAQLQNTFTEVSRGLQKEVQTIKQPIDETITSIGNSQCANVKKLIGVDYSQVAGVKEPNLDELSLNFRSKEVQVVFNITSAATRVSEARGFDPRARLIIYIHGFTDNAKESTNFNTIAQHFLKIGEFNILGLDASTLIRWLYLRSTTYVRFIGERLGEVLAAMIHQGLDPKSIHLIGHSLGAHIAGYAGKRFHAATGLKPGRISGLDPAGPCFTDIAPDLRLQADDADFVDVIHTDKGVYGIDEQIGHVDFYPNDGKEQPNCLFQTCSHSRVNDLYAESITNPRAFLARACKDYDEFKKDQCQTELFVMGYNCPRSAHGRLYLRTGEDAPYGLGERGAKYENDEGVIKNVGAAIFG